MSYFLKVNGAPFEYNGLLWNDDPTRILKIEDYVEGSALVPFTFANGVTVYEPTQLVKPIFWELTGYTTWYQVWDEIENQNNASWAHAFYRFRYGTAELVGRAGFICESVWETVRSPGPFLTCLRGENDDWVRPAKGYNTVGQRVHSLERGTDVAFVLVGPTTDAVRVHCQQLTPWVYASEVTGGQVALPEVKAGRELNYSADPMEYISGFLHTDKDKDSEVYLGLELEVSTDISVHELQHIVQNIEPKQEAFFICKKDRTVDSSRSYAYEIVTVPMTPARMRQEFKTLFGKLNTLCKVKGKFLSDYFYSSEKNGLHIHISKKAFEGDTRELRRAGNNWGSKFLAAFNSDFMQEIKLLSQLAKRINYTKNTYCGIEGSSSRGRRVAYRVGAKHLDIYQTKYSPAHGNKPKTYEVRLFAGLVDLQHVLCSIDTVEAMYLYTGCHGAPMCVRFADTFKKWLATQPGYRALKSEILKK